MVRAGRSYLLPQLLQLDVVRVAVLAGSVGDPEGRAEPGLLLAVFFELVLDALALLGEDLELFFALGEFVDAALSQERVGDLVDDPGDRGRIAALQTDCYLIAAQHTLYPEVALQPADGRLLGLAGPLPNTYRQICERFGQDVGA